MSLNNQQYADLANDAYKDYTPGVRKPGQRDEHVINGVKYNILEHVNNRINGYQGTIYQRVDTGEIVVAHRGTEELVRDGVIADGAMVLSRTNPQAKDAIELTKHAVARAEKIGQDKGHTPQVTVTGHSLGGTLAQITAHHFNLYGETFNAYGAVSLQRRVPEGGNSVLNHVLAADTVSAGSPHFGQVRIYALPQEIDALQTSGYQNNHNRVFDDRSPLVAAGRRVGSHSMHNFTNQDGEGRPDRSILADPQARQLAQQFDPMIDKFRDDVRMLRAGITVTSRGPAGWVADGIDYVRGPLQPGEPAARENAAQPAPKSEPKHTPAWPSHYDSPLFGPGALPELPDYVPKPADGPTFPQRPQPTAPQPHASNGDVPVSPLLAHERLPPQDRDIYDKSITFAQRLGLPPEQAQNAAMAITAQAKEHGMLPQVDRLFAIKGRGDDGGDRVYMSYHPHGDKEPIFNTHIDLNRAAATPTEDSLQRITQHQQQQVAQTQQHSQTIDDAARGPRLG